MSREEFGYFNRLLTLKPVRVAVDVAERQADGQASDRDLKNAHRESKAAVQKRILQGHGRFTDADHAMTAAMCYGVNAAHPSPMKVDYIDRDEGPPERATLLRCIFANPFRSVTFDPRWRTSDTVALAQAIYDHRAFERLPILGDALMDAGCEDEQIIGHCRSEGPHVRGCWVVDLVLNKQ